MSKQLNQWLDEFIENGADATDVGNWPKNAGGGNIDISPFVCFKAGVKITIDFKEGQYSFNNQIGEYPNGLVADEIDYVNGSGDPFKHDLGVILVINEARTQIVATLQDTGGWSYDTLSDSIVIYNGPALADTVNSTTDIDYAWPTVEFTVDDDINGIMIFRSYDGYSVTN